MRELRVHGVLLLSGLAAMAGALWLVFGPEPPTTLNLALFLILLVPAVAGPLAPLLAWLHRRVSIGGRPPSPRAAVRQALLIGLAVALLACLQLLRLLDGTLALSVVALVILTEALAQSRAA